MMDGTALQGFRDLQPWSASRVAVDRLAWPKQQLGPGRV